MAPELRRILTTHAKARAQQRGIAEALLPFLFDFGTERHDRHGGVIVCFDRAARRRDPGRPCAILARGEHTASGSHCPSARHAGRCAASRSTCRPGHA